MCPHCFKNLEHKNFHKTKQLWNKKTSDSLLDSDRNNQYFWVDFWWCWLSYWNSSSIDFWNIWQASIVTTGEEQWTEWTNTCFASFSIMLINFLIVHSQPEGIAIYLSCYCTAHRKNTNTPVLSLSETKIQSTRDTIRILWLRSSRFKKSHLPWSSTWRE